MICHLEGSGQWPQDAEAIQRVRAAFQLRLAELLTQQHGLQCRATATHTDVLKVRLVQGRDNPRWGEGSVRVPQAGMYVPSHTLFQQDGFVFRIRVAYQREPQILKEVRSPEGMISLRDTPASLRLEKDTKQLPLLTSALHGYDCLYRLFCLYPLFCPHVVLLASCLSGRPDGIIGMSSGVRQVLEARPCHFTG